MSAVALALSVMLGAWSGPEELQAALALENQSKDQEAIVALEALASREPDWALPRLEAARLHLKLGTDLEGAKRHVSEALQLAPENPRAHYVWGLIREEEGAEDEAIAAFEKAVALREDYFDPRFRLAGLYFSRGRWEQAEQHYRAIAMADPGATTARLQLAAALEQLKRLEEAEEALLALREEQPLSVVVRRKLVEFYERTGQPRLADRVRRDDPSKQRKLRPLKPSRR